MRRFLILFWMLAAWCFGITYYVNGTTGNNAVAAANGYAITQATNTITKTDAFLNYTYHAGDQIQITVTGDNSHAVVGFYTIASRVDKDSVTLTTDPTDGTDDTNVTLAFGNDGSGDSTTSGALTGPWKTIGYAVDTAIGSHGEADVIRVADGEYGETAGGTTYWYLTEDFTSGGMTIQAENAGQVTIHGAGYSTSNSIYFDLAQGITFDGIVFTYSGSGNSTDVVYFNKECQDMRFLNCTFTDASRTTNTDKFLIRFGNTGTNAAQRILFYNCNFIYGAASSSTSATPSANAIHIRSTADSSQGYVNNLMFVDCTSTVSGNHAGFIKAQESVNGLLMDNCTITQTATTASTVFVSVGIDGGNNAKLCGGPIIQESDITMTTTSHGILFGAGCFGGVIQNNTITGTTCNYTIACKSSFGSQVRENEIIGGTVAGLISRGMYTSSIVRNTFYGSETCVHLDNNDGSDFGNFGDMGRLTHNVFYPINTGGNAIAVQIDSVSIPNWLVDYNCYSGESSITVYPLRADGANKTRAQANTWWASYGTEAGRNTNDDNAYDENPNLADPGNGDYTIRSTRLTTKGIGIPRYYTGNSPSGVYGGGVYQ